MPIKVLIVDDSKFICQRIQQILQEDPDYIVVGTASNGQQAVQLAVQLQPDVITMDVEMPIMDGISAVRKIMHDCPTPILMLSAATQIGAQATLDALNAGAIDFMPKHLDDIDGDKETAKRLLRLSVRVVAQQARKLKQKHLGLRSVESVKTRPQYNREHTTSSAVNTESPDLLMIAASTGGPVAIQKVVPQIRAGCSFPVLLIQHMPENFTKSFAERLDEIAAIDIRLAEHGDELKPGLGLLAPGGKQTEIVRKSGRLYVKLRAKLSAEVYSPCVDITLTSVSRASNGKALVVVLTGMGSDGKLGVQLLKRGNAQIWAQDEASCTIYGMPKAIIDANLADRIFNLDEIADAFKKLR